MLRLESSPAARPHRDRRALARSVCWMASLALDSTSLVGCHVALGAGSRARELLCNLFDLSMGLVSTHAVMTLKLADQALLARIAVEEMPTRHTILLLEVSELFAVGQELWFFGGVFFVGVCFEQSFSDDQSCAVVVEALRVITKLQLQKSFVPTRFVEVRINT